MSGGASWDAGGKTIKWLWLKDEQSPVAGSYDPAAHIAVAYTEGTELSFKNACALLKFKVAGENVSEVCVYTTGGGSERLVLSGNFNIDMESPFAISTSGDGYATQGYVKVVAAEGTYLENGKTYYMTCLPVTAVLNLEVVANGIRQTIRTTSAAVEIKRNDVLDLGNVAPVEKTLYLTPGKWSANGARFELYAFNSDEDNSWFSFEMTEGKPYKVTFPYKWGTVILVRKDPNGALHTWDGKWNQSDDIKLSELPEGHNHFTINDGDVWDGAVYTTSVYTE